MKPAQKLILNCRQLSESLSRLSEWLTLNPALLGPGHQATLEDIESLACKVGPIAAAADAEAGIAVVGTAGARKTDLVFAMLGAQKPLTIGEFGTRPVEPAALRDLLPPDETGGCAIIRYSAAELPPAPRGYPFRVGLLSIPDVAAIITTAAYASMHPLTAAPAAGEISDVFDAVSQTLSPQAVPGLSARDVIELREGLNARWPDHPTLAALSAARYWEQLQDVAAHLNDRERRRVLQMLWHRDGQFTTVFNRLCDGLDRLGQGSEAYCTLESLLGKDRLSGWTMCHPHSVIHARTLRGLEALPGPSIGMMNRYGQEVEIERAVLAGLITELSLHLVPTQFRTLPPAEILDFPVPPPVDWSAMAGAHSLQPDRGGENLQAAVAHYARAKAVFLFERACQRRDVTSLVMAIDPKVEDDTYAAAVTDWIESAQGSSAHARERVRRGLFIATADLSPVHRAGETGRLRGGLRSEQASTETRVLDLVRDVIGGGQDWPDNWTPNRPLRDVYWFAGGDGLAPAAMHRPFEAALPQAGTAVATSSMASPATATASTAVASTAVPSTALAAQQSGPAAGDRGIHSMVRALALSSDVRIKHLQLNHALSDVKRRTRTTLMRYHASNDPGALADWRRAIAVVVQDRLLFLTEHRRLSHVQRALCPKEDDLIRAMLAHEAATANEGDQPHSWQEPVLSLSARRSAADPNRGDDSARAARLSTIAITHWLRSIRSLARSPRKCRDLMIEPGVMQNLVEELQIGVVRAQLVTEIALAASDSLASVSRFSRTSAPHEDEIAQQNAPLQEQRIAAYAVRIIAAYLELLSVVGGKRTRGAALAMRPAAYDLEVADQPLTGYGSGSARPRSGGRLPLKAAQARWELSFVNLVEDNISSAHLLAQRGDKDREVGELIKLFAADPFEVEA